MAWGLAAEKEDRAGNNWLELRRVNGRSLGWLKFDFRKTVTRSCGHPYPNICRCWRSELARGETPREVGPRARPSGLAGLSGLILYPGLVRDPVHFPALTSIVGKGLLKVRRIWSHLGPNESDENRPAIP